MSDADKIGGSAVTSFLEKWKRHPISLSIVTIVVNLAFVFMILHGGITPLGIQLTQYTFIFSGFIFLIVFFVLLIRKNVLYNSLDVMSYEIRHRISLLVESLSNIEIGNVEPYEEVLESICSTTARNQINEQIRADVKTLEYLVHISHDCGENIKINGLTNLALAKFYYKEGKYKPALEKANSVSCGFLNSIGNSLGTIETQGTKICPGEVDFFKGLILRKLHREEESLEQFEKADKAGHERAKCWKCCYIVESDNITDNKLQEFIDYAENDCSNRPATENCINKLATAYYKKAKYFSSDADREINMRKALENVEIAIDKFDSWPAYYNKACDLSTMAYHGISHDEKKRFEEIEEEMKGNIFTCLKKAYQQKPALIWHSRTEQDLIWVKKNYKNEFDQLVGSVFNDIHDTP